MQATRQLALQATRELRGSSGYAALGDHERRRLDADLRRVETALGSPGQRAVPAALAADPYAVGLETPNSLRAGLAGSAQPAPPPTTAPPAPSATPAAPHAPGTQVLGERARATMDAVDFPAFVAGLIQGTFQAIVDATAAQVRQYAELVASLASSVGEFSRDNVTDNQARDWMIERHGADVALVLPRPGEPGQPRLQPRSRTPGSPDWLSDFDLAGQDLTAELLEGPLLAAARQRLAESRMKTLATMVLMGINRVVVEDGQIRARMQFHAKASETVSAQIAAGSSGTRAGIAQRDSSGTVAAQTMVSTLSVNAQADIGIKAELMGEVQIRFRSETFDLNQFATTPAIQLINQHARPAVTAGPPAVTAAPAAAPAESASGTAPGGGTP